MFLNHKAPFFNFAFSPNIPYIDSLKYSPQCFWQYSTQLSYFYKPSDSHEIGSRILRATTLYNALIVLSSFVLFFFCSYFALDVVVINCFTGQVKSL